MYRLALNAGIPVALFGAMIQWFADLAIITAEYPLYDEKVKRCITA